MQHIPDLYADIDSQMLKRKVQALESAITNPKPWVGLTVDETAQIIMDSDPNNRFELCRNIEAKLKDKNT
jgi:hypothetical protein